MSSGRWSMGRRATKRAAAPRQLRTSVPSSDRPLRPSEVEAARLDLAAELVELVIHDNARLGRDVQQQLRSVCTTLTDVRQRLP